MHDWLPCAILLASTIAICAMLSGLWRFRTTQRLGRTAKAVDLDVKFTESSEQLPQVRGDDLDPSTFWQINVLPTITESIAELTDGDPAWAATVEWMLEQQQWFLAWTSIRCKSYSASFVARMKKAVPAMPRVA